MKYYNIMTSRRASLCDKMKPVTCESCKADGYETGVCPKCLENQAYNTEWLETHTFIWDTALECYHSCNHDEIKSLPLRLPNEKPNLYYGFEVEVGFDEEMMTEYYDDYEDEERMEASDRLQEILARAAEILDGMAVFEEDSSLQEYNGVEFIFRPMSYAYATHPDTVRKLKKFFDYLEQNGAYVNQPTGCGMHVHLSKKFFEHGKMTNSAQAYEDFEWLFQFFQPEMEKLGRRKYTSYCESKTDKIKRDMRRMTSDYGSLSDITFTVNKGGGRLASNDHSSAINSDRHTIEVRTFKSTINAETMLATLEIVRNVAHAVRGGDIEKTLDDILHTKDNIYLDKYIQKRRMECKRDGEELDLSRVNTNKIRVTA